MIINKAKGVCVCVSLAYVSPSSTMSAAVLRVVVLLRVVMLLQCALRRHWGRKNQAENFKNAKKNRAELEAVLAKKSAREANYYSERIAKVLNSIYSVMRWWSDQNLGDFGLPGYSENYRKLVELFDQLKSLDDEATTAATTATAAADAAAAAVRGDSDAAVDAAIDAELEAKYAGGLLVKAENLQEKVDGMNMPHVPYPK